MRTKLDLADSLEDWDQINTTPRIVNELVKGVLKVWLIAALIVIGLLYVL